MPKIAVIIPAFNEEANIEKVVRSINAISSPNDIRVIPVVINDGSKDQTSEIIDTLNCVKINHPFNLGIGATVQTGMTYAFKEGFDYAIQIDGDGQHPADIIITFHDIMQRENLDVLIGSRYIENKGFQSSAMRRIGIKYFQWLNHLLLGVKITDNTSGLRMFNRKALAILVKDYPDDYPEPEAIVLFKKNNLKFREEAVSMSERSGGQSSISSLGAIYYMIKVTLAIVFAVIRKK